jgi:hypothetical protein
MLANISDLGKLNKHLSYYSLLLTPVGERWLLIMSDSAVFLYFDGGDAALDYLIENYYVPVGTIDG